MTEEESKPNKAELERDEEIDLAKASEITRHWIKDNIGSLISHEFRIENIRHNGDHTRYIVFCSLVPDIGEERIFYLIKVDVVKGSIIEIGRGKKQPDESVKLEEVKVEEKWKK